METVRGYSITGYWYKENNQLWHNCGQKGLTVPAYRGILEQFFFFKSKNVTIKIKGIIKGIIKLQNVTNNHDKKSFLKLIINFHHSQKITSLHIYEF